MEPETAACTLAALEEMLRIMPKHKGTSKLQADVKTRIASGRARSSCSGRLIRSQ